MSLPNSLNRFDTSSVVIAHEYIPRKLMIASLEEVHTHTD